MMPRSPRSALTRFSPPADLSKLPNLNEPRLSLMCMGVCGKDCFLKVLAVLAPCEGIEKSNLILEYFDYFEPIY